MLRFDRTVAVVLPFVLFVGPGAAIGSDAVAFTATTVVERLAADGRLAGREVIVHAQRADGSIAEIADRTLLPKSGKHFRVTNRHIIDLASGAEARLLPDLGAKMTWPLRSETVEGLAGRPEAGQECAKSRKLHHLEAEGEDGEILGFAVQRFRKPPPEQDPSRAPRLVTWVAPALGCFELQREERQVDAKGEILARNTSRTISVSVGPPNETHFQIPAHLEEKKPSELPALAKQNSAVPDCPSCALDRLEEADRHIEA